MLERTGNDLLRRGAGDDTLFGGNSDDMLQGGAGLDVLIGDRVNDERGRDTFIIAAGEGLDIIVDFEVGTDLVGLSPGIGIGNLSFEGNTIRLGGQGLAQLNGVGTASLNEESFVQI
ncbi:MAG: hypothetical protein AAFQ57_05035 [Cyanobacteria bacterium J06626_14]